MEDILPEYLAIGVSYERFMDSCPVDLEPFSKANKRISENQNYMMYLQGIYVRDAIMSTVGNRDRSQGTAPYKYPEKPYPIFDDDESSEQEKQRDLQQFFAQEEIRRANWRLTHPKKKEDE